MYGLDIHNAELEDELRDLAAVEPQESLDAELFGAKVRWERGAPCAECGSWCGLDDAAPEPLKDDVVFHIECLEVANSRAEDYHDTDEYQLRRYSNYYGPFVDGYFGRDIYSG